MSTPSWWQAPVQLRGPSGLPVPGLPKLKPAIGLFPSTLGSGDHVLVRKLSVAGRKEGAKLLFIGIWAAGVVQGWLLSDGIGTTAGVRYGVGVSLVIGAAYTGVRWALLSRQLRASRSSQH